MRFPLLVVLLLQSLFLFAQKKAIDHSDVAQWRKIDAVRLSNDGRWAAYTQIPNAEGDAELFLWNSETGQSRRFQRASEPRFSDDNQLLVFRIKPALDSLKNLRRKKVKDEDLPKDTLAILTLSSGALETIPRLRNFSLPEKWAGVIAYQLDPAPTPKTKPAPADSSASKAATPPKNAKKAKKEDKDNGYRLYVRHTASGLTDTFAYVLNYTLAKKGKKLLFNSSGKGDTLTFPARREALQNGVYLADLEKRSVAPMYRGKGKFQNLQLDEQGRQAAFLSDTDTTKARIRPWQLRYASGADSARTLVAPDHAVLEKKYLLNENTQPLFSEDGQKLYFGMALPPVLNDTTQLPEEIVQVEVWAWTENRIYSEQKNKLEQEKKRTYTAVWLRDQNRFVALGSPEVPELRFADRRNASLVLGFNEEPYARYITSEGTAHKDLYAIDMQAGTRKRIVTDLRCNPRISPEAGYISWWSAPDTAWFAWGARTGAIVRLTDNRKEAFYDEETDVPDYPDEHGMAAWLGKDEALILYDRFDLWQTDPSGKSPRKRLTRGREQGTTYRYVRLDPEERYIEPGSRILLHHTNEASKAQGYAWLDLKTGELKHWLGGDYAYARQVTKAKNAPDILFTKENYATFPDLRHIRIPDPARSAETLTGSTERQLSQANPQQNNFRWSTIEMVQWTSLSGQALQGMLVKPEDFDPAKQYPMIVNFYERQSDELLRHRAPDFHRSQINFPVYASKGYLIFVPDIVYKTGYPGESAYDAIMSGVTHLMDKGFVKKDKIALQGHSWGGYQTAYLITKTNLFACAESGAPVVNMTSAYGGIRWESGLSRAFQYERQQSRIGGTLWEYPLRFLENSPLFSIDKVQTPVLILHNDKDGAVPWQQGIEMYSALRRLDKPCWMLNYNDEPHWPVKLQNRMDFQKRMMQFFDHYLQGAPAPQWMQRGVPPMEKGILQGLETGKE